MRTYSVSPAETATADLFCVIPAEAGTQCALDSRLRGNDVKRAGNVTRGNAVTRAGMTKVR